MASIDSRERERRRRRAQGRWFVGRKVRKARQERGQSSWSFLVRGRAGPAEEREVKGKSFRGLALMQAMLTGAEAVAEWIAILV